MPPAESGGLGLRRRTHTWLPEQRAGGRGSVRKEGRRRRQPGRTRSPGRGPTLERVSKAS